MSKNVNPKLWVFLAIMVCNLIFYALGVESDFFASTFFSAFWVVSAETSHMIVRFLATAGAVILALGLAALAILLVREYREFSRQTFKVPRSRVNKVSIVQVVKPKGSDYETTRNRKALLQFTDLSNAELRTEKFQNQNRGTLPSRPKQTTNSPNTRYQPVKHEASQEPYYEVTEKHKPEAKEKEALWDQYFKTAKTEVQG